MAPAEGADGVCLGLIFIAVYWAFCEPEEQGLTELQAWFVCKPLKPQCKTPVESCMGMLI